jgi:uncharacterized protein (DUF302 family)
MRGNTAAVRSLRIVALAAAFTTIGIAGTACGGGAAAHEGGKGFDAVPDRVTRLMVDVGAPFDEFKSRFEQAVPAFSPDKIAGLPDWNAVVVRTAEIAPHGFLLYGKVDASPVMRLNGHTQRAVTYLMGNHTVAETMYGKDPGVMLYAPLRTLIYEDLKGKVHFSVDQPSTRFSSFDNDDIAATGKRLDQKLASLMADLGLPVPGVLRKATG